MTTVRAEYGEGREIDLEAAGMLMDREISEKLHASNDAETDQEWFNEYCTKHLEKYGEEFEPNKLNGQW